MRKLLCIALVGCGSSSSPAGEPLVSGSVSAAYAGNAFMPAYGFATVYMGSGLIGFAEAKVHCGTEKSPNPPSGSGVIVQLPSLAVGTYSQAYVQVFRNTGNYMAEGSTGTVVLSTVNTTVMGTINFSFTDSTSGQTFSANGSFEVINCMP